MRFFLPLVAAALFIFSSEAASGHKASAGLCEREMGRASVKYAVPLAVLYAVGLTETEKGGNLHPFSLNVDGRDIESGGLSEAVGRFHAEQAAGAKLIDIGCMQINFFYHGARFASLEAMFDPALNVEYAAKFLKQLRLQEGNWTSAVARYNAGPNNPAGQKKYICRVLTSLDASGFGAWTPTAKAFCLPGGAGVPDATTR